MKKTILLTSIFIFLSLVNGWSQRWGLDLTWKANYTFLNIEDTFNEIFDPSANQTYGYYSYTLGTLPDIYRNGSGKLGLEFGISGKYRFWKRWYIIGGVKGVFTQFNTSEEFVWKSEPVEYPPITSSSNGEVITHSNPIDPTPLPSSYPAPERDYNKHPKTFYIHTPINLGFSPKSEKWLIYGGVWYARLIESEYKIITNNRRVVYMNFYNNNLWGTNLGFDFNIWKDWSLSSTYTYSFSNLFTSKNEIKDWHPISQSYENPYPTQHFGFLSLGLTYKLK